MVFKLVLNKVLLVEDLSQVFFGIVVELYMEKKYHSKKVAEDDTLCFVVLFSTAFTEELEEETDLFLFGRFKDFGWVRKWYLYHG